jgi:hypothetical protein
VLLDAAADALKDLPGPGAAVAAGDVLFRAE